MTDALGKLSSDALSYHTASTYPNVANTLILDVQSSGSMSTLPLDSPVANASGNL